MTKRHYPGRNCRPHPGGSADRQLGAARGVAVPRRPDGTARPGGRLSTLGPQGAARGRGRQPWGPGRTMGVRPRLQHGTTLCPQNGGMAYLADPGNTWEHFARQYATRGVPSNCSLLAICDLQQAANFTALAARQSPPRARATISTRSMHKFSGLSRGERDSGPASYSCSRPRDPAPRARLHAPSLRAPPGPPSPHARPRTCWAASR